MDNIKATDHKKQLLAKLEVKDELMTVVILTSLPGKDEAWYGIKKEVFDSVVSDGDLRQKLAVDMIETEISTGREEDECVKIYAINPDVWHKVFETKTAIDMGLIKIDPPKD